MGVDILQPKKKTCSHTGTFPDQLTTPKVIFSPECHQNRAADLLAGPGVEQGHDHNPSQQQQQQQQQQQNQNHNHNLLHRVHLLLIAQSHLVVNRVRHLRIAIKMVAIKHRQEVDHQPEGTREEQVEADPQTSRP